MKKLIIIGLLICTGAFTGSAQSTVFTKSYGNNGYDYGRDIKQTLDTGYIATGSSSSFGSADADAFLLKIDSVGNFKWSYNYGGTGSDWGESVLQTSDSAFALVGYTNSFGAGGFDFYLVKTDQEGTPEWEKTYGGSDWDRAYDFIQLPDSGFVLVGETYSFGAGSTDIYIVRTDKEGNEIWSTTYGGEEMDFANAVVYHSDSIIIAGGTESYGEGNLDGIMLKYHIDGTFGQAVLAGQEGEDYFTSIIQADDYYLCGGTRSYHHFGDCDCSNDFWMYKTDTADFSVIADTSWTGEQLGSDIVNDLIVNTNNDIFYGGSTTSWGSIDVVEGKTDAFIGKLLNNYFTASEYIRNFGELEDDVINGMDHCFDNGMVAIGSLHFASTGGYNVIIVRNDPPNSIGTIDIFDLEFDNITLSTVELNEDQIKPGIYPTLFDQIVNISGINEAYGLDVYDVNGKIVYTEKNTTTTQIDLSALESGLYMIQITASGSTFSQKIIKR